MKDIKKFQEFTNEEINSDLEKLNNQRVTDKENVNFLGTVIERCTGKPLERVLVRILDTNIGGLTNNNGEFEFSIPKGKIPPKKAPSGDNAAPKPKPKFNFNSPPNLRELSEKDTMNVLEMVRKEYNIDENRIFLMGHSMGGGIVLYIALNEPERVNTAVVIDPADLPRRTVDLAVSFWRSHIDM